MSDENKAESITLKDGTKITSAPTDEEPVVGGNHEGCGIVILDPERIVKVPVIEKGDV